MTTEVGNARRLNALARAIRRLERALVTPGERALRIRMGLGRGVVLLSDPSFQNQRVLGIFEMEIASRLARYARNAATIVDVGANDGFYTVILALRNRDAVVFSCDPLDEMRERCQSNLQLNGLDFDDRVRWVGKAVTAADSSESIRLDTLLDRAQEPILIKMDIEGGELEALQGAVNVLRDKTVMLIIETHSRALERACAALLDSCGFSTGVVANAWWRTVVPEERVLYSDHSRWIWADNGRGRAGSRPNDGGN